MTAGVDGGAEKPSTYGAFSVPTKDHENGAVSRSLVLTCVIILVLEAAGKLAAETFNGTQVFFLGNLQMDPGLNDGMTFARDRFFMVLLILCGKLGECGIGRFETITLGSVALIVGVVMVSLGTHPWLSRLLWYLIGAFFVLPFNSAALEANLPIFLADQFNCFFKSQRDLQEHFFWWFNVAVNLGAGLAISLLSFYEIDRSTSSYLTSDDFQDDAGIGDIRARFYWSALIISSVVFVLAMVAFVARSGSYSERSREFFPSSSPVGVMQYLVKSSKDCSVQGVLLLAAKVVGMVIYVSQALLFWCPSLAPPLSVASAVGVVFTLFGIIFFCKNLDWLDEIRPPDDCFMPREDIKDFLRLLPLLVCSQMAYGTLFSTMNKWFTRQTCQMDLRYVVLGGPQTSSTPQIFLGYFPLWTCGAVVLGTPICLYLVHPRLERCFERAGLKFHDWTKFLIGILFALASILCAAHFEVDRRTAPQLQVTSSCAPFGVGVRDFTAHWMVVPYGLMGISAMYVNPTIMMIAYRQVPRTMRSMTIITNIFMMSASNSLVIAVSMFMKEYTPHDLDTGNLEYLYFLVMLMSLGLLALFVCILPYFQEKIYPDLRIGVPVGQAEPEPAPAMDRAA